MKDNGLMDIQLYNNGYTAIHSIQLYNLWKFYAGAGLGSTLFRVRVYSLHFWLSLISPRDRDTMWRGGRRILIRETCRNFLRCQCKKTTIRADRRSGRKKFKYRFFQCIFKAIFLIVPPFGGLGPRPIMCVKRQKAFRFPNFSSVAGGYEAIND